MLHDLFARYPGWLLLALILVGGFPLATAFSAILERADRRYRAKLQLVLTTVFTIIAFSPLIVLGRGHWLRSAAEVVALVLMFSGSEYFRAYPRLLPVLWVLGVLGLDFTVIFGAEATQHRDVLDIVVCAISALFGGFCFGCFVTRWRAERAAMLAEARQC
jgi:hypothetical protein